tara:strand:+ start:6047 stop:6385 length:339 start_codon:yes stop_codon:yes gene_type:complete
VDWICESASGVRQSEAVEVSGHLTAPSLRALVDGIGAIRMIKRRYFYSGMRRGKKGGYAWTCGTIEIVSWLPLPAGRLLEIAEQGAKKYIEIASGQQLWFDLNVHIVAFNRI